MDEQKRRIEATAAAIQAKRPAAAAAPTVTLQDNSTRGVLGQILQMSSRNPMQAQQALTMYGQLRQNPASQYYNPYANATNRAVGKLASLGFDVSSINDDWYNANSWLKQYYVPTDNTNSLSSTMSNPKKSTPEQQAAYYYNQLAMAEETTKKAEQEWASLQNFLSYWANQKDRNYSDEEIMNMVDWSKYKTLQKMDETKSLGTPMELNRAVGYSKDAMYGVLWAARNGGGTGDSNRDMAYSALGTGKTWQKNDAIAAKLDPTSTQYAPYSVGCTMDDERARFGQSSFDATWLRNNRDLLNSGDEDEKKAYIKVMEAEEDTQNAEKELKTLKERLDRRLGSAKTPEAAKKTLANLLESGDFPTLAKMDKTRRQGYGIMNLTRAVDYRYEDMEAYIDEEFAKKAKESDPVTFADETMQKATTPDNEVDAVTGADAPAPKQDDEVDAVTGADAPSPKQPKPAVQEPTTEQSQEIARQQDQTLADGIDMAANAFTPTEQEYMETSGSVMTDSITNTLNKIKAGGVALAKNLANSTWPTSRQEHIGTVLGSLQMAYDYDQNEETLAYLRFREAELAKKLEGKEYVGQSAQGQLHYPMSKNGRKLEAIVGWDGQGYRLVGIDDLTNGYRFSIVDPEDWKSYTSDGAVDGFIEKANEKAAKIAEQNKSGATLTEEEQEQVRQLQAIRLNIEDAEAYQREHAAEYEQAKSQFKTAQDTLRQLLFTREALGMNNDDIEKAEAVAGYLTQFNDYEATYWSKYNPSNLYADALASGEDKAKVLELAKQGSEEVSQELETARLVKAYLEDNKIEVPGNYMKNLDRHIAKLERDQKAYEYFALSQKDNFAAIAEKGRKAEYNSRPQRQLWFGLFHNDQNDWSESQYYEYQQNGVFDEKGQYDDHGLKGLLGGKNSLMTKDELDTYYYLLGTGDEKAAQEYATFLADPTYGVLWTRNREATEGTARGIAADGFGGFLAGNALAVIMSPMSAISAMGNYAFNAATGSEFNPDSPFLTFSHFRSATREESAKEILETFGDKQEDGSYAENWKSKLAQAGYEIVTNRADSAMNAWAFGGLFGEAGESAGFVRKAVHELLSASPMGLSASADAAAEAKRKGASDSQAYLVAAVTLLAETATEAISLENIKEAQKIGEEFTSGTVKEFVKNWLTNAGISEAFGESLNDIIENTADELIMGNLSDHADRVWEYRMKGMDKDEAELAARRDEMAGVLRTALISYASPGLDIISTGAGRLNYYKQLTREHQQSGDNRSMLEIMRGERKARKDLEAAGAEIDTASQKGILASYEIMNSAKGAPRAAQTAAIASALSGVTENAGTVGKSIASAAAARMPRLFGRSSTMESVQKLFIGAAVGRIDLSRFTKALQIAALSKSSDANRVINSSEFKAATPDEQAKMLADTVDADAENANVTADMMRAVREHRVAVETKNIIAGGGLSSAQSSVAAAQDASRNARVAEAQLEERQAESQAAQEAVNAANEEVQRDPINGESVMNDALAKRTSTAAVEQEYTQKAETSQRKEAEAKEKADQDVNQAMTQIRQEAETRVDEIEAQEAQEREAAAVAEQQRVVAEQEAQVRQESIDNAQDADVENFIDTQYADATDEEKQHIREMFDKNKPAESVPDQERTKFLNRVAKKFGLAGIVEVDASEMPYGANGLYDRETNTIKLNRNATVGDALYFVLGHELTHVTEAAGDYTQLADAILQIAFGSGTTYQGVLDEMKAGRTNSPLARMVKARRDQYQGTTGKKYDDSYYLQEIVADNLGLMLKGDPENPQVQQNLINRLVADNPSTARKIMEAIKNFLKRAVGMRGAWQTDMQHTVDLFSKALEDVQKNREQEQTAKPLTDNQGNETAAEELRGGTVAVDTERLSLNSFNEAEQERTRAALLAVKDDNGKQLYTPQEVDEYMANALGIAALIAADKTRLDFKASDNQVFLKKNSDYYFTLDASTLCAKRLLYQGTFNYVQHALPYEVFTPEDLIDLVNIMNEMGYETPCGICYVESRRRWLDTYANEFINKTLADPESFIQKKFKNESDEEKAKLRERLAGEKPAIEDLTTTDGLEKLRHDDPYMYKAYVTAMNAKGTQNPKVVQLRTEYRGDIGKLTAKDIQKVKDIGGLRIQSFSDFETPHLLDMIQAVYDMAAARLTSQAYTKVPNFAWVFGDTGIKINLSLIGKGTGVDDNGNLIFDNKEGMNIDEALKLRDKYNANVGTVLVGINDDHVIAAMGDPRIDYIIPFHKSGWSDKELSGISTLQHYEDFTDFQNERVIVGKETVTSDPFATEAEADKWISNRKKEGKTTFTKETKDGSIVVTATGYKIESFAGEGKRLGIPESKQRKNFEPVGANKYWRFDKSGEWNARNYLTMCAKDGRMPKFWEFLVDNGDGSFSLPEGDDPRSTAIREGYWKTLVDFKMYENDGYGRAGGEVKGSPQREVTPDINMDQAARVMNEYQLSRPSGNSDTKMVDMKNNNEVPVATTAGDEFIRRIKEKRAGKKPPTNPNKPLEATPEIDVMKLGRNRFADDDANQGTAASAFGATQNPATLGNTPSEYQEDYTQGQQRMAIDAETGESTKLSLNDIDSVFNEMVDSMSLGELDDLFGIPEDSSEETVREIQVNAVKDLKDEFDPTIYNGRLYLKPETLNHWLSGSGFAANGSPNYAQAYITTMNPADFLRMTTTTKEAQQAVLDESRTLDETDLGENAQRQPIQLHIDESTGKIIGHEGRHRSVALARAGVTEMPVLLFDSTTKYSKTPKDSMTLEGQNPAFRDDVANGNTLTFNNVIPLSQGNADLIRQQYLATPEDEAAAAENGQRVVRYSLPAVAPVQSSDESVWQPGHTESWFRENGFPIYQDVPLDQQEINRDTSKKGHGTQIASTESTYRKLFDRIRKENPDNWQNMRVLDASSGLGFGTQAGREMGFNVTDIEPFPSSQYSPDYTDYIELLRQVQSGEIKPFDYIISNAVLNVIPQDTRDNLVVAMGKLLAPGGKLFINTISKDYSGAAQSNPDLDASRATRKGSARTMEGDYTQHGNAAGRGHETFVWGSNSVQKVFSYPELIGYLKDALGDGYTIKKDSLGMTGVLVTKNGAPGQTRYSLPADAPYMAAVERGEMDVAQQLVDEKAEEEGYVGAFQLDNTRYSLPELEQEYEEATAEDNQDWQSWVVNRAAHDAGYQTGAYHGSPETDITEFNTRSDDTKKQKLQLLFGTHFTQNKSFAEIYTHKAKNSKGTSRMTSKTGKVYDVYLNLGNSLDLATAHNYTPDTEMFQLYNDLPANIKRKHKPFTFSAYDTEQGLGSGEYITARHMEDALQDMSPKDATEFLVDHGYNSVQYLANYNIGMSNNRFGRDPSIIMLDPEKIKSADPVTYDDQGNVIPLSERFKSNNNDIRYQLPDDIVLEKQIREYLAGGGSLQQQQTETQEAETEAKTPRRRRAFKPGPVRGYENATVDKSHASDRLVVRFENYPDEAVIVALKRLGLVQYKDWSGNWGMRQQPGLNLSGEEITEAIQNAVGFGAPEETAPQRQWGSRRAERSPMLHEETVNYLKENSDYDPDTNSAQVNRAFSWIQSHADENDPTGYNAAVADVESSNFDSRSADGQARLLVLMGMAAVKGDTATELRLADAYNRQGTDLGQALQFRKAFQLMTPLGRQAVLKKEADKINENYKKQGKNTRVTLSPELLEEAGKAKNPKDFDKVRNKAAKELAAQMPANWKDKLTALRMLAMLGNTRTHIRNVLGNALFMPVVGIKNKLGAATEIVFRSKTRTKTLGLSNKQARDFAKADAKEMEAVLRGDAKYKDGNQVEQNRKAFGQGKGIISKTLGKATQGLIDFNGKALEAEDWIFLSRHYRNALAGYMTANKLKAADMKGKTLDDARAYAVQEAQKATYRDANKVIEGLNKWEASHPGVKFFGSAILPFKKTPANILKRGVEYSPVGLLNALTRGAKQVKMWNDYQKGKLEALPDRAISPAQWIDKISAGLTGTGIMVLGAMLSGLGAASAGLDDDDDEFAKLKGEQEYAINPGKIGNAALQLFGVPKLFGEDVSYTADWAAPVCMPFFVGAAIMDTYKKGNEDLDIAGVLNDLMGITEPVFNLSMLDGVNSLLEVNQYAEGNAFTQIFEKILTNYASSFVPTLVGQITRTKDTTRRKAFVESGAELSTFKYAWETLENKLPWLSTTNIPYRDVWGNAETSSTEEAAIENFISPGYANQIKDDPVVKELERIYNTDNIPDSDRRALVPKAAGKTIGNVKLNAEQYDQYVVTRGQTARQLLEDLMESPYWQISDDPTRAKMVSDAWTYANQIGQHEVVGKKLESWVLEASTNGNAVQTIVSRTADSNRKDYVASYGKELAESLENDDGETFETCLAALEEAGATNAEIRSSLRNHFKQRYQEAYLAGDEGRMFDIEDLLLSAGVGFKSKDFESWIPSDEEEEFENAQWLNNR